MSPIAHIHVRIGEAQETIVVAFAWHRVLETDGLYCWVSKETSQNVTKHGVISRRDNTKSSAY